MGKCSKQPISLLKQVTKQLEARLTRTASVALTNAWKQKQSMITYQSEYDIIQNHELSNSALPFQTQEGVIQTKS